jgi:hypothetical protein
LFFANGFNACFRLVITEQAKANVDKIYAAGHAERLQRNSKEIEDALANESKADENSSGGCAGACGSAHALTLRLILGQCK